MKSFLESPLLYLLIMVLGMATLAGLMWVSYRTGKAVCGIQVSQAAVALIQEDDHNKEAVHQLMGKITAKIAERRYDNEGKLLGTIRLIVSPRDETLCVTPDAVEKAIGDIR